MRAMVLSEKGTGGSLFKGLTIRVQFLDSEDILCMADTDNTRAVVR